MDQCPLCNAERVPGEEYCLSPGCGYHFKDLTQSEPHSQTDEELEKQKEMKEKQESTAHQPEHSFQQTDNEWMKNKKEKEEEPQGILVLPDKKEIPLEDDLRTVGRGDVMQFVGALNGPDPYLVSRQQFTIWRVAVTSGESPYHYFIEDVKNSIQEKSSGNGTRVNGEKITGQPKRMLQDGDKIQFAEIKDCVAIFQIK